MKQNNTTTKKAAFLLGTMFLLSMSAHGQEITWDEASGSQNTVTTFFRNITMVLMYVMAVVSIVITVLAFKGLAGQGDWRTFWNKIAGAVGMFAVPTIINFLLSQG